MKVALVAAGLGLMVALLGTPLLIRWLRTHKLAQAIRVSPLASCRAGYPSPGPPFPIT